MVLAFKARIEKIEHQTPKAKIFMLKIPDNVNFTYETGQFAILSIDDFLGQNGNPIKRPYSIASSPLQNGHLEFCISWAHEGGFSDRIHNCEEGDFINVEGPFGAFNLKQATEDITFIAAGSGIAPLIAMIRTLFIQNTTQNVWLFFGFRYPEDFIYKKELTELAQKNQNFHLITSISTADPVEWNGERGRINLIFPKYIKNANLRDFYLCGPPPMIQDSIKVLLEIGADKSKIYKEGW